MGIELEISLAADSAESMAEREENVAKVQISRTVLIVRLFRSPWLPVGELSQRNQVHEGRRFIGEGIKHKEIDLKLQKCVYLC